MQIAFSEKYNKLFEILSTWDVINSKDFNSQTKEYKNYWIELSKIDTILLYGGRDSGKSFAESVFIPLAVNDYKHRVLYTRYTMNSTDQSISEALRDRIDLLGFENNFNYSNNTYEHINNGGKIFIAGQKTSSLNQTAKLKSLENFSMFVTDEADEMRTYDEWDKIRKSIRATDVQCFSMLVFNPPTYEHWIYTNLFEDKGVSEGFTGIKDNILYIHTTYLDNYDNVAEHNLRDYLRLKELYDIYESYTFQEKQDADPKIKRGHRTYKHVVLGGFLPNAEGVIFENWEFGEFDDSLIYIYGLDFGSRDPDALVKVSVDNKRELIYVDEILYLNDLGTPQLAEKIIELVGHSDRIVGDSEAKRTIRDLYDSGVNIVRCRSKNKKIDLIKKMQGYKMIVTPRSKNVAKALNNYAWKENGNEIPLHEWSHIPDAIRYAFMEFF